MDHSKDSPAKDSAPKPDASSAMNGSASSASSKPSQPSIGSLSYAQLAASQKPHEPFIFIEDEASSQPAKKQTTPDEKGSVAAGPKPSNTASSQRVLPATVVSEVEEEFDPSWWQCSFCTFLNKPLKTDIGSLRYNVCAMCEKGVRPGTELPPMQHRALPAAARIGGQDQLTDEELQALAPVLNRILQLQSAPTLLERSSSGESTHSDVVNEHDETWRCPQCTFVNEDALESECRCCLMIVDGKKEALELVVKIIQNVLASPEAPKFRKIRTDKVLPRLQYGSNSALPILLNLGFRYLDATKEFLVLPTEVDLAPLREFSSSLEKAVAVKQKMMKLTTERLTPEQREAAQLELFMETSKKEKNKVKQMNPVAWASYMKRAARKSLSDGKWEEAIDYAKQALTFFHRAMYPVDHSHLMLFLHVAYKNRTQGDKAVNLVDSDNYLSQVDQQILYNANSTGCNRPDCANCKRRKELMSLYSSRS